MANIDFAALLCSRLCHDLVSPVGAINNGLEILQEEQEASMREAVIDLIEKSTKQTSNKLQFFRLAFGAAGGFSSQLDVRECQKALNAFLEGSRVDMEWAVELTSASKNFVKIFLNLGLVVSETMIRGGTMRMAAKESDGRIEISVSGEGQRVILQAGVKRALEGSLEEEELDPRAAPAFLARTIVEEADGALTLEGVDETSIAVKAVIDFDNQTGQE